MTTRIYGFHPVREALRHRSGELARVLVERGRRDGRWQEIADLCRRAGVALREVEEAALGAAQSVHNGFAAELRPAAVALGEGVRAAPTGDAEFLVLVEDVQDPRNLGALLRVCEGAGVGRVLVRDRGSAALSPAAVKAAAGASEWIPIERVVNSARALEELKRDGFWIYGAAAGGAAPWTLDLKGKIVLCFGGEEKGLRQLTREHCDKMVGLPMRGHVGSLNLSTAAAAILYDAVRQRVG